MNLPKTRVLRRIVLLNLLLGALISQAQNSIEPPMLPTPVYQTGHTKPILYVGYSPDGMSILSQSRGNTIQFRDVNTKQKYRHYSGSIDEAIAFSVSSDGKIGAIADAAIYANVKIMDLVTGKIILRLNSSGEPVSTVVLSPDGNRVAAAIGKEIKVWEIPTGKEVCTLSGHTDQVTALVISPDNQRLYSGSRDHNIKMWDIQSGKMVKTMIGHTKSITTLTISPNGVYLISASDQEDAKLWNLTTGYPTHYFRCGPAYSLAITPDNRYVAIGSSPELEIWDIHANRKIKGFKVSDSGWIRSLAFSPDGRHLLCGGDEKKIRVFEWQEGNLVWEVVPNTQALSSMTISQDGTHLLTTNDSSFVHLWDLQSGTLERTFASGASLQSGAILDSTATIFAGGWDPQTNRPVIKRWNFKTFESLPSKSFDGNFWIQAMSAPSQTQLIWASGPHIHVANANTMEVSNTLGDSQSKDEIRFLRTRGEYAISRNGRGQLSIWNIPTGKLLKSFEQSAGDLMPDGQSAVILYPDQETNVISIMEWDLAKESPINPRSTNFQLNIAMGDGIFDYRHIETIAVSPDSKTVAWTIGNRIYLLDRITNKKIAAMEGHTGRVISICFSGNSHYLFTASDDGTVKIWDVQTGKQSFQLTSFNEKGWVISSTKGYYNHSNGTDRLMSFTRNGSLLNQKEAADTLKNAVALANELKKVFEAAPQKTNNPFRKIRSVPLAISAAVLLSILFIFSLIIKKIRNKSRNKGI